MELKGEGNEREMVKALWVADRAPQVQRVVLTLDALPTPPLLVAVSFALKALLSGVGIAQLGVHWPVVV